MTSNEDLEFSINQYLDGTLGDIERPALESLLATNLQAQAMLQGERELTDLLRAAPLPAVRWDQLAQTISSAIDQQIDEQLEERAARASWWIKLRAPVGVAAAASVLLAAAVTLHSFLGSHTGPRLNPGPVAVVSPALVVDGPQADRPAGPVVEQISVSAGGEYAQEPSAAPYADDIDGQASRVLIASGVSPEQTATIGFPF